MPARPVGRNPAPGPFKFDRRRCQRLECSGRRLAVVFAVEGGRNLLPVELLDASTEGLGLRSARPLEADDRVTLYDEGRQTGFVRGRVVRCAEMDGGWRIGVALDRMTIAA
ncbi:MAG: PilZ domain-containing protein [Planctomycetota bacterium]